MLDLNDQKWLYLEAAYRKPIDLRPLVHALKDSGGAAPAWTALWQELLHQGDVGVGSYAVVPHLVRIYREQDVVDWNAYALVASIEVARGQKQNPPLPSWAEDSYKTAIRELAGIGLVQLPVAPNQETVRSILAILAIAYGVGIYGRFLIEFTEDETAEVIADTFGG